MMTEMFPEKSSLLHSKGGKSAAGNIDKIQGELNVRWKISFYAGYFPSI